MERFALSRMKEWKENENRKPLIIRGARQVGKTWIMKTFGQQYFEKTAYVNFDNNARMKQVFEGDLDIERLVLSISAETGVSIEAENTLIIFDEVQEVPKALTSLKYFYENAPQYAIVAAESLLGVALHQGTSFPVGKVDFLDLYPLNFREFLCAMGEKQFVSMLDSCDTQMVTVFKTKYIERLREYYFVGGMPEVVKDFSEKKDYNRVRAIQKNLINYYQQDFSKHAEIKLVPRLNLVWNSIPMQLAKENKKFFFGQIKKGARSSEFEIAIQWLLDCGLVYKVNRVNEPHMPLKAYKNMNAYKLFVLDVGLLGAMSELPAESILEGNDIFVEFKGALTEQYVLQQLISDTPYTPYYYGNEKATFEQDFLIQKAKSIVPIEVKAEQNIRSHSLKTYCEKFQPEEAVRFSTLKYKEQERMVNIPLYAVCNL